jgi:hypothetical protein
VLGDGAGVAAASTVVVVVSGASWEGGGGVATVIGAAVVGGTLVVVGGTVVAAVVAGAAVVGTVLVVVSAYGSWFSIATACAGGLWASSSSAEPLEAPIPSSSIPTTISAHTGSVTRLARKPFIDHSAFRALPVGASSSKPDRRHQSAERVR